MMYRHELGMIVTLGIELKSFCHDNCLSLEQLLRWSTVHLKTLYLCIMYKEIISTVNVSASNSRREMYITSIMMDPPTILMLYIFECIHFVFVPVEFDPHFSNQDEMEGHLCCSCPTLPCF